jgi:hypothetical protein
MKKQLRWAIAAILLITILLLAQYGGAWAGVQAVGPQSGAAAGSGAPEEGRGRGGTVKPPPHYMVITAAGTYSLGGCIIHVENLAPNVIITVNYISRFHDGHKLDDDDPKFMAGTCLVTYYVDGKKVDQIEDPGQGSVQACFAAPQTTGTVHEYSNQTKLWTHRPTTLQVYDSTTGTWRLAQPGEPALTCGQANLSGYYLVAGH